MNLKRLILLPLLFCLALPMWAGGGMWIPSLLETLNESEMQDLGMRMSAEDIYSVNQSSLKDAIVKFGRGCTGSIISDQGLLLTNHHCGFSLIQRHSTLEQNYLKNGFWAKDQSEEITNAGLTVTFIVRMEDITKAIMAGDPDEAQIQSRIDSVERVSVTDTHYDAEVKAFYQGNEYYLIIKEIFKDVRLVGAPPLAVGKFGGETDNWIWPRHNADFSLFRVYTAPDGKPAEYSPDNIPMKPKHYLPVSIKGVNAGDFTMVYGFPYRTDEYLPSYAIELYQNVRDPQSIALREIRLTAMEDEMRVDEGIRLMYANKASGVANAYKKWKGRIRGLKRNDAIGKKKAFEATFAARVADSAKWEGYKDILGDFEQLYGAFQPLATQIDYFYEGALGIELMLAANQLRVAVDAVSQEEDEEEAIVSLNKYMRGFHKSYISRIDQRTMAEILQSYYENMPKELQPDIIGEIYQQRNGDFAAHADYVFSNSILADSNRYKKFAKKFDVEEAQKDPAYTLFMGFLNGYIQAVGPYEEIEGNIQKLQKTYMQAQRDVFADQRFFPDANHTLRVSYGQAEGMKARDGVSYQHYTTLDGVVQKYIPGDYEFDLPTGLVDLYNKKDFGRYATDGTVRVAFIASNHTSGGNSGSPVIDADGNLIGLNFDRNWEGTMSDFNYDVNQCRNISVDVRYILFIVDKFAGATNLIEELTLVE
ncbi:MAG: S46 family peptidase [Bacteroidota bacterium]